VVGSVVGCLPRTYVGWVFCAVVPTGLVGCRLRLRVSLLCARLTVTVQFGCQDLTGYGLRLVYVGWLLVTFGYVCVCYVRSFLRLPGSTFQVVTLHYVYCFVYRFVYRV